MMKRKVQVWLLLMAAVLVFLWFASTRTAYASGGGEGTESLWPGEGGGLSNAVEGFIYNEGGGHVSGIWVFLETGYLTPLATTTDSEGYYKFEDPNSILPNSFYHIAVNGEWEQLGVVCINKGYGQWYGIVETDDNGYAWKSVWIEHAAIVDVPAAAIFSNTKYATVSYEMTGFYTVSHSLTFSVPITGISLGYQQSTTATYGLTFSIDPNSGAKISRRHYAASYWDDTASPPRVKKTGISGSELRWYWDLLAQSEYLTTDSPAVISNHSEMRVDPIGTVEGLYYEQGSTTWSVSQGVPYAVSYMAYGVNLNLDVTVTTSGSNKVSFKIDRSHDPNPDTLTFWIYTPGAPFDPDSHTGGMEFHIWDASGAG
jgi:hypothetical protein